jgi:hypothetical protein
MDVILKGCHFWTLFGHFNMAWQCIKHAGFTRVQNLMGKVH